MMRARINVTMRIACLLALACNPHCLYSDELDDFKKQSQNWLQEFKDENAQELEDFRAKINAELVEFMKKPWPKFRTTPPIEQPKEPEPIVVILDEDDPEPVPSPNPKPIVIEEIIDIPTPSPQPQPVSPVEPRPVVDPLEPINISLYGTAMSISGMKAPRISLSNVGPEVIAAAYERLSNSDTAALLKDCLNKREQFRLGDWAYIKLVQSIASKFFKTDTSEFNLLCGYILNQCGYDIRYAYDQYGHLYVWFTSTGHIYDRMSIIIDKKPYYCLSQTQEESFYVCPFKFPGEKPVSFEMTETPRFTYKAGTPRSLAVHSYPTLKVQVTPNSNLIDFYNDYPTATVNDSHFSKWAIYANIPASKEMQQQLYPSLRQAIAGKSQKDAANILIKLAESFDYKLDREMWGVDDRALFPDESWNYFYSDCEDHAIHFTRLVRDLMGLDAVLVYYPGHLASAVAFTDGSVTGDYVNYKGKRFTICDPTYFYAPVGVTMVGMDNSKAILVDLRR